MSFFKKLISTVMGLVAGLEFILVVIRIKHLIMQDAEFSNNPFRLIIVFVFLGVIMVYRELLIGDENGAFTKNQIISIIILIIIFIVTLCVMKIGY